MAGLLVIGCTAAQPSRSALPSLPAEASWIAFSFDADGGWDFEGGDAEIYLVDDSGGSRVNVTNHPANDFSPEWSPDGSTIVFRTNRDGDHEIYAMNADGSDPRNLTRDPGEQRSPAWSPDGAMIAYASAGDDGFDIWLMDADGGNPRRLPGPGLDEYPTFSPDGSRIAFTSYCAACTTAALVVMDVDGSDRRELAPAAGWPDWSTSGMIGFDALGDGVVTTYRIDPDDPGSSPTPIGEGVQLDWAPDGRRFAYTVLLDRPDTGIPCCADIAVGDLGGGESRVLTDDIEGFAFEPTWQP